jgi:hypothetical protein
MPRSPSLIWAEDSFASLLLQQGVSAASVQRQLGYGSIQLTVDTYGKWLRWAKKAAVDGLDSPSGSKGVANASQADAGDEKTQGNPRATRRSRTGDLLITKGRRRLPGGSGGCSSLGRFGGYALALTHREAPAGMGMVTGW